MIPNGKGWHYLTVKHLLTLLKGITFKQQGELFCFNCIYSFATKNKLESPKKICENKFFFHVVIPSEDTKLLEFNKYQKYEKATFTIYVDLEGFIEKADGCKNNNKKLIHNKSR